MEKKSGKIDADDADDLDHIEEGHTEMPHD